MRDEGPRYVEQDRRELVWDRDGRDFDRVAFTMRALERLAPKRMTVAVYSSAGRLNVQRGRDLKAREATWAIIGVPKDASREYIAYAVAELAGVENVPYTVQLLLADVAPYR